MKTKENNAIENDVPTTQINNPVEVNTKSDKNILENPLVLLGGLALILAL